MATAVKKVVLLVEDETALRYLYRQVISDAGYIVLDAADGDAALSAMIDTKWDICLLDIMLPKKDGLQILKEIQSTKGWKKGPVVLLTNLNSEEVISNAFALGADGFLIKSEVQPDKLLEEIEAYLSK